MSDDVLDQLVSKARDANHGGFGLLSTSEKLAAALILNRADWLASMNYTVAQAIGRVGPEWAALIPTATSLLEAEGELDA